MIPQPQVQKVKDPQITQITVQGTGKAGEIKENCTLTFDVFISPTPTNLKSNLRNLCNQRIFLRGLRVKSAVGFGASFFGTSFNRR
jgi:hypothetical protein